MGERHYRVMKAIWGERGIRAVPMKSIWGRSITEVPYENSMGREKHQRGTYENNMGRCIAEVKKQYKEGHHRSMKTKWGGRYKNNKGRCITEDIKQLRKNLVSAQINMIFFIGKSSLN